MNPLKKFLAILLGSAVVLGATIALADDSATTDDSDDVSVEQTDDAAGTAGDDADPASEDAPGQIVPRGDDWTSDYARGLEVATEARDGVAPAGMTAATTAGVEASTSDADRGKSAEHRSDDSDDSEG